MTQTWNRLLFAHWPVRPLELRPLIPEPLELDTFEGKAWLGVVPFDMTAIRARLTPPLPYFSNAVELNVRTYVTHQGKPGVWFFSLDCAKLPLVAAARTSYFLPYYWARMSSRLEDGAVAYETNRIAWSERSASFLGSYRPVGPVSEPVAGTLEHFLTERYCLYTTFAGTLLRAEIHHDPWPLQQAEAELELNTMALPLGFELSTTPPLLHYADRLVVLVWPPWPAT